MRYSLVERRFVFVCNKDQTRWQSNVHQGRGWDGQDKSFDLDNDCHRPVTDLVWLNNDGMFITCSWKFVLSVCLSVCLYVCMFVHSLVCMYFYAVCVCVCVCHIKRSEHSNMVQIFVCNLRTVCTYAYVYSPSCVWDRHKTLNKHKHIQQQSAMYKTPMYHTNKMYSHTHTH